MSSEPFFIINPNAQAGRIGKRLPQILDTIKQYFGEFQYEVTKERRSEVGIARKAIEDGYKTLVAIGGDGTATNTGDVVVEHPDVKLGLVAAGSMCDWHKTHSIPLDIEDALALIVEGYSEKFPAMKCSGDHTFYSFDMADGGFTGKAAAAAFYELKWLKLYGLKYNYLALKYVLKSRNIPATITIDNKEPIHVKDLTNAFASLGDEIIGLKVFPSNAYYSLKNKDMCIAIVYGRKGFQRISMLVQAINAKHLGGKGIWLTRGRKVTIETEEEPFVWEAEGEIFNEKSFKVTIELVDDAINLIVPKEREYPHEYSEIIYQEKFEDTKKKRKLKNIKLK